MAWDEITPTQVASLAGGGSSNWSNWLQDYLNNDFGINTDVGGGSFAPTQQQNTGGASTPQTHSVTGAYSTGSDWKQFIVSFGIYVALILIILIALYSLVSPSLDKAATAAAVLG